MNRYSTAILLTGLLIILTNKIAIAKDFSIDSFNSCYEIINRRATTSDAIKEKEQAKTTINNIDTAISGKSFADRTQSSFWWAEEQFDPFNGNLVENWLTYPEKRQINLVVSWRLWTLLDYLGRYRFVNQFGTVARKYGYSLTIFNQKSQCLASYQYNSDSNPPKWELNLEKLGRDSLPIEPQPMDLPLLDNGI